MTKDIHEIGRLIKTKLTEEFKFFEIIAVNVSEDTDFDGDAILWVDVIYDGDEKKIDNKALASTVERVRPVLLENDEDAFPVFSFILKHDIDLPNEISGFH